MMTITENAAANVAAYGALLRRHNGTRLRYARCTGASRTTTLRRCSGCARCIA